MSDEEPEKRDGDKRVVDVRQPEKKPQPTIRVRVVVSILRVRTRRKSVGIFDDILDLFDW